MCFVKKIIKFSKKKGKCAQSFVYGSLNSQDCE